MRRTLKIGDIIEYKKRAGHDVYGKVIAFTTNQSGNARVNVRWTDDDPLDTTTEQILMADCFKFICNINEIENKTLTAFAITIKTGVSFDDLIQVMDL